MSCVEQRATPEDPLYSAEMSSRAKVSIYRLAGDLEQLAEQADHYKHSMPASQCCDISNQSATF